MAIYRTAEPSHIFGMTIATHYHKPKQARKAKPGLTDGPGEHQACCRFGNRCVGSNWRYALIHQRQIERSKIARCARARHLIDHLDSILGLSKYPVPFYGDCTAHKHSIVWARPCSLSILLALVTGQMQPLQFFVSLVQFP